MENWTVKFVKKNIPDQKVQASDPCEAAHRAMFDNRSFWPDLMSHQDSDQEEGIDLVCEVVPADERFSSGQVLVNLKLQPVLTISPID